MKKLSAILLLTLCLLTGFGCSHSESFVIEGEIKGAAAQTVTLTYFSKGGLKQESAGAVDGRFVFSGTAKTPTLAIVSVAPENLRIATLVVSDGDKIKIKADLNDPLGTIVDGNSDSEHIARWISENKQNLLSRSAAAVNGAVTDYVTRNTDKLSATAILTNFFLCEGYESSADSLFTLLSKDVRPVDVTQAFNDVVSSFLATVGSGPIPMLSLYERCDSIIYINPMRHRATLLCFLDEDRRARDSVVACLRDLTDAFTVKQLRAVEISTARDSASWRRSIGNDTVAWPQTWPVGSLAASPLRKLAVGRVPFFIVTDSTGNTLYRGPSVSKARQIIEQRLN